MPSLPACPPAQQLGCHGNGAPARLGPTGGGGAPGPAVGNATAAAPPPRRRPACRLSVYPNGSLPPSPSILAGRFPLPWRRAAPHSPGSAGPSARSREGPFPHCRQWPAGSPSSPSTATQVPSRCPAVFPQQRLPIAVGIYTSIYI